MTALALSSPVRSLWSRLAALLGLAVLMMSSELRAEERPLLSSPYGELCTTCEGFALCEPDAGGGDVHAVLLHVQSLNFWQQIGTIWSWLRHLFAPVRPETRTVTLYHPDADGGWAPVAEERAVLDLGTNRIDYPGAWIDRGDGAWHDQDGRRIGQCVAVAGRDLLSASSSDTP